MALSDAEKELISAKVAELRVAASWFSGPRSQKLRGIAEDLGRLAAGAETAETVAEPEPSG